LGGGRVELATKFVTALEFGFQELLDEFPLVRFQRPKCGIDRGW
jgi:hypothetical protein